MFGTFDVTRVSEQNIYLLYEKKSGGSFMKLKGEKTNSMNEWNTPGENEVKYI